MMSDIKSLSAINLNLLIPLKALLELQSVTAAAEALNTTQPTMSRHLSALRGQFDDKLLVRVGSGYQLTPKAVEIKQNLEHVVADLSELFFTGFHPDTDSREFVIACPDYVFNYALVDILSDYFDGNNGITFSILNWDQQARQLFMSGAVDFVLSIEEDFGANCIRKRIDSGEWVCLLRNGHPLLDIEQPEVEDFIRFPFAKASTGGGADKEIELFLKRHKIRRNVKLTTQNYLKMYSAVRHSNLLSFIPRHQAEMVKDDFNVSYIEFPLALPKVYWSLYWHEKYNSDEAHQWLRGRIIPSLMGHKGLLEEKG